MLKWIANGYRSGLWGRGEPLRSELSRLNPLPDRISAGLLVTYSLQVCKISIEVGM